MIIVVNIDIDDEKNNRDLLSHNQIFTRTDIPDMKNWNNERLLNYLSNHDCEMLITNDVTIEKTAPEIRAKFRIIVLDRFKGAKKLHTWQVFSIVNIRNKYKIGKIYRRKIIYKYELEYLRDLIK